MTAFVIWAHRGASAFAPENTLAAFHLAEDYGATAIELDVHVTADGVPVVIHDDSLDRTTSGHGVVRRLPLATVRQADAGAWFSPAYTGERVPTLEEVFVWAGDRLRLNVEIKSRAAAAAVLALLQRFPAVRVLLSSFHHDLLEEVRRHHTVLPLGFLTDSRLWRRALARARAARAESFHPRSNRVSATLVTEARAVGLAVYPYTVDDPALAARLREMGCAGVFSNRLFPRVRGAA